MPTTTGMSRRRLVLNLGLRYDGLPHAFERYDKFSNFVPELYDTSLGNPVAPDGTGTLIPSSLSTFPGTTGSFYLNGIREAGVNGFPRGNVQNHYYTFQPRVGFAYDISGKREDRRARRRMDCSTSVFRATTCTTPR